MIAARPLKLALLLASVAAGDAAAEVMAAEAGGFIVAHEMLLQATPARAYQALTEEVAAWWDADHSYSGRAASFTLDARPGGCFCERLDDGGGVEHMRVAFAAPGQRLRMIGGLGPLQGMGASGPMDFDFSAEAGGTRLQFRYTVSGFAPDGLKAMAEPVDRVMGGQLARLAAYLKTGDPDTAGP